MDGVVHGHTPALAMSTAAESTVQTGRSAVVVERVVGTWACKRIARSEPYTLARIDAGIDGLLEPSTRNAPRFARHPPAAFHFPLLDFDRHYYLRALPTPLAAITSHR